MESAGMKDGECRNEGWRFNDEERVMRTLKEFFTGDFFCWGRVQI